MMSAQRDRLHAAAKLAVASGRWTPIGPATIRWKDTVTTPRWCSPDQWPEPTYDRLVFLSFRVTGAVLLGVSPAPWMGRRDTHITLTRAAELLAAPTAAFTAPTVVAPTVGAR